LAVAQAQDRANRVIDAIGPETFTYRRLVEEIGSIIGVRRPIVSVPPSVGYAVGAVLGKLVGDVMITRDEVEGLMADLLVTSSPPAGSTRLTDWAREHADTLGKHYASELARRKNRQVEYGQLR
jgi:NADH dehydrogenase